MATIKELLEKGEKEQAKALIPNTELEKLYEALIWAIGKKDYEMVELFCQSLTKTEWLGRALGYASSKFGDAESVKLLLKAGANVNYCDGFGTPLITAAKAGNVDIIQLLAEAGANLNYQDPDFKNTALHEAVRINKIAAVKKLVELGADVKIKNRDDQTPINLTRMNIELRKFLEEAAQTQEDSVHNNPELEIVRQAFKNPQAEQKYQNALAIENMTMKTKKALQIINEALALEEHPDIYLFRGQIHDKLGQSEKAILDYSKAIELAPHRYEGYFGRGKNLSRDYQFQKALADFDKAIQLNPCSETFDQRGRYFFLKGDQYEASIKDFTRAIDINDFKDDIYLAEAYSNRADCYDQLGKHDLASADRKISEEITQNEEDFTFREPNEIWIKIKALLCIHPLDYIGLQIDPLPESKTIQPCQSKLGGKPYLPTGFEFPKDSKGNSLAFLAQINFAEMPELKGYPENGLAQFYINMDSEEAKVIYFPDIDTVKDDTAAENTDFKELVSNEYRIKFNGLDSSYPYPNDHYFYQITQEYQPFDDEIEELQRKNEGHRIGGYAFFCQEDPRSEEYRDYIQLLQIDELENEAPFTLWGDSGAGHFFIHPDDLKKCDFSKVLFYWDCY